MQCSSCGRYDELRMRVCFDCAHKAESVAAKRTVVGHVMRAIANALRGEFEYSRYDLSWARQRMLRCGDYANGGYFDEQGHDWR